MKSFFRIFKYVQIPRNKLILYLSYTLLATLFSLLSINLISPFMDLIFKADIKTPQINSKAIGPLKDYFQSIIDRHGKLYALATVCTVIIIATIFKNLFAYLSLYVATPVKSRTLFNFRSLIFNKILSLPISFFSGRRKGDLMSRITVDVGEVQASVFVAIEGLVKDPFTILGFLISMVYISPGLSLFMLVFLPVTGLIIGRISKHLKKQSAALSSANGENLAHVEETLGGIKVLKAFTAEKTMTSKFSQSNEKLYYLSNRINFRRDLASPITEILGVSVLCIILYIGGSFVFRDNSLNSGDLMSFIISFAMIINPAKSLSGTIANVQRGLGAIDRIEEILHAPMVVEEKPDAEIMKPFTGSIEFKNVSFNYGDAEILKNINLKIEKGKTVAIVGSSGAGKSTLADLVPRFHDPVSGSILINGVDIKNYTLDSLRKQMSIVTQEPILFNDTIGNNIALGNINASKEEITQAAKIANAHQFIMQKEEGYDTNTGDRGVKLSGGERQRMTIARAVLQNPPILILDEATSSLDTESERLVQDALNNLMKDRTSLVIAHRLSTIRNADEIIVMQKGEIIERGSHESLYKEGGFYKKLVEMQEIK